MPTEAKAMRERKYSVGGGRVMCEGIVDCVGRGCPHCPAGAKTLTHLRECIRQDAKKAKQSVSVYAVNMLARILWENVDEPIVAKKRRGK